MKRTTIHLGETDREAIRIIRQRFGVATDSDAIRLAVRVLSVAQDIGLAPMPNELEVSGQQSREGTREAQDG